jgi:hypothetical protein
LPEEEEDVIGELSRAARRLSHLGLSPLQAEVLRELVNGDRTIAEITDSVFGSRYTDEYFERYRNRVRRAVKGLEREGIVSKKRLLGRDKPYGLTHHGLARITSISPGTKNPAIYGWQDLLLFSVSIASAVLAFVVEHHYTTILFAFLLGATVVRSLQILWKVM